MLHAHPYGPWLSPYSDSMMLALALGRPRLNHVEDSSMRPRQAVEVTAKAAAGLLQLAAPSSDSASDKCSSCDSSSLRPRMKRRRGCDGLDVPIAETPLVLPGGYEAQGRPIVECPYCKGLYATKIDGTLRKHKCVIPLSAVPASAFCTRSAF